MLFIANDDHLLHVQLFQKMALLLAVAQQQRRVHKPRVFRDRTQPLDYMDDDELISRYRLPRQCIVHLCDLLAAELQRSTSRSCALPVTTQILVALRFYSTGSMQRVAGDLHGISQPSVSRCVHAVSKLLTHKASGYISFPTDDAAQRNNMDEFYRIANFPNVLGCIDGTQIQILSPVLNENIYVCRKGFHSLNVQAICNAQLEFINIVAKYPGSAHDSFIWHNCAVYHYMEQHTAQHQRWLLGDSGYPLSSFLMTPIMNATTPAEMNYNKKHSQTRNTVERAFGPLKMRFRCLHNTGGCLQSPPERCAQIITACAVLHNMCVSNAVPVPDELDIHQSHDTAVNDSHEVVPGHNDNSGVEVRRKLIDRFRH